jgi:DNA-binding NtrC family response regulator
VILLDLRLPDQSGLEVYEQIRRIDARIPVIFITMAKGADAAIEAMKHGAYDYLFKPLGLEQLRRVVDEALDVARRMRQPAIVAETPPDPDVEGELKAFVRHRLAAGTTSLLQETQQWMEEIVLPLVLEHTQGNRRQAARILGVARQTLRSKLRELGVTIQSSVDFGDPDES